MIYHIKKMLSKLPEEWQLEIKRFYFGRQIDKNRFETDEPEYSILSEFVKPGDWVVDVGANIGHYTKKLSELVETNGRVFAFEPIPSTFNLLCANVQKFLFNNVTLINSAASNKTSIVEMVIPYLPTGLKNYYQSTISFSDKKGDSVSVLSLSLDSFAIEGDVTLVKIDVEGHEKYVLDGMKDLIKKNSPVLIVETSSEDVISNLQKLGYTSERLTDSPNILFRPSQK